MYGHVDDNDKSLRSKAGGKFGLNNGFITKIEFNPLSGKGKTAGEAIDITFQVGEKEFRNKIFDVTGMIKRGNTEIQPSDEGYLEAKTSEMKQRLGVVTHAVKAVGVNDDMLKAAVSAPTVNSFKTWAETVIALIPTDFATKPIQAFLEYQWNISEGQDKTFLQLPSNMKGGRFLCATVPSTGAWTEVRTAEGMSYTDDAKSIHPFDRDASYMKGNKAIQQFEGANGNEAVAESPISQEDAKKGDW